MPHAPQQQAPRETFIALRARRRAFSIGINLLYHDLKTHPPARVLRMPAKARPVRGIEKVIRIVSVFILASMALTVVACIAFSIAFGWIQLPRLR